MINGKVDPSCRSFVKDVKRIIIKVGTAVVSRGDGRLALGRLGYLCEQIKDLNSSGYEVILVTSGAVGVGRQKLRYRKLVHSSFADLQKPQMELEGKACASVGQSGLMALYDVLFNQLDITSSLLLVTDNDFHNENFREQLVGTVNSLLASKVVPVFNENDAVSTRCAPYEDSSGIFWDNDSLAALLAKELKADLLFLLSDVDGLYSGPPSDPNSKLIHTYIKEIHQGEITFGDKSRLGRGGMTAKVNAAKWAASEGTPVVITSGFKHDNILKVLQGECIGTLFHPDASSHVTSKKYDARELAVAARQCSRKLQGLSTQDRRDILLDIADALEKNEKLILNENKADVSTAIDAGHNYRRRRRLFPFPLSELADFYPPKTMKGDGGRSKTDTKKVTTKRKAADRGISKAAKKAMKDPNKPKRPPSAFFVFMEQFRKEFKELNPNNKSVAVVGKASGDKWRSLTDEEKAPYIAKAEKLKAEYSKQMDAYNNPKQNGESANVAEEEDEVNSDKSKSEVHDGEDDGSSSGADEDEDDDA